MSNKSIGKRSYNYRDGDSNTAIVPTVGYSGTGVETQKVHHTLPIAPTTACGFSVQDLKVTYDLSRTTCDECARRLRTPPSAEEVSQAVADAGWLRTQGEDFASLRKLVEAVNGAENRLVGDDKAFTGGGTSRAHFVRTISMDLETYQNRDCGASKNAPPGGLSHDDASVLIFQVRTSVESLRKGQAWPDDARRAATDLENKLDSILGQKK